MPSLFLRRRAKKTVDNGRRPCYDKSCVERQTICASGGIGRLAGFRCQCSQGRAGSTPASRTSSEIPATVPFPASPKTALWREFLRFQPRPAALGSRLGPPCGRLFQGLRKRHPLGAFSFFSPRKPAGPRPAAPEPLGNARPVEKYGTLFLDNMAKMYYCYGYKTFAFRPPFPGAGGRPVNG